MFIIIIIIIIIIITACVEASQPFVTVASEYPHSTLNGTATCRSHSSTAYYETYVAGRRNLDV